jgi:hypothetical protein
MNTWRWIFAVVALVGLACGPVALETAAQSQPPLRWSDVPLAFLGSAFGGLVVIGFQILRTDPSPSRWALRFFGPMSVWITASGLSAALFALGTAGMAPYSVFMLAVGSGLLFGVLVAYALFRRKFKDAL